MLAKYGMTEKQIFKRQAKAHHLVVKSFPEFKRAAFFTVLVSCLPCFLVWS